MPLSKARNKKRMQLVRLHKQVIPPQTLEPVQPSKYILIKKTSAVGKTAFTYKLDAEGNPIPDYW